MTIFLHISRCSFCTSLCSAKYKLHTVGFTNTKITIFFYIFQGVRLVQVFAVQNTNCTVLVYEHQDHDFFTYFKVFLLYKSLSAKRKLHSVGFMNTKITIFYIFQGVHLVKVFAVQNANCTVLVLRTPRSRFFYIFQAVRFLQVFAVQNANCTVLVYEHQDHNFFTYVKVFLLYKSLSANCKLQSAGLTNTKIIIVCTYT